MTYSPSPCHEMLNVLQKLQLARTYSGRNSLKFYSLANIASWNELAGEQRRGWIQYDEYIRPQLVASSFLKFVFQISAPALRVFSYFSHVSLFTPSITSTRRRSSQYLHDVLKRYHNSSIACSLRSKILQLHKARFESKLISTDYKAGLSSLRKNVIRAERARLDCFCDQKSSPQRWEQ